MYYYEDEVAKATKETGIRAVLGETVVNFPSPDSKEPYGGLEYSRWFIEKWKNDDLIIPAVAPHAPYTNDKEHLQIASNLSKKYAVPMMMHVAEMYKRNMKVGLGTDGPMSGNTLDIVTQMPLVGKIHKLFNNDRSLLPATEIVEMATIGGARVLNLDKEIGSIEIGKKADLVLFETESINMQPIYDYYSVLVYSANPSNVDTVIVNGQILVKNKKSIHTSVAETVKTSSIFLKIIEEIKNTNN